MISAIFSGGTGFTDIGLNEADAEAVKRGACEVAEYMVPTPEIRLNGNSRYQPMFRYYFNMQGTEIGYFTHDLNCLLFHKPGPRTWDAGFKAGLIKDSFQYRFQNLPDDGRLALDTPERRDQESYFGQEDDNG